MTNPLPGRADDKWRASLEEAREYVRNLWRNKALREREHYALIAILNDVERLAASPPPPAPTSEIERGMAVSPEPTYKNDPTYNLRRKPHGNSN